MSLGKIFLGVAAGAVASHIVMEGASDADRWICGVMASSAIGVLVGRYV